VSVALAIAAGICGILGLGMSIALILIIAWKHS
jgi:hypothetical protein